VKTNTKLRYLKYLWETAGIWNLHSLRTAVQSTETQSLGTDFAGRVVTAGIYNIDVFVPAVRQFTTSVQTSGALKDKWTHINCTDGFVIFV